MLSYLIHPDLATRYILISKRTSNALFTALQPLARQTRTATTAHFNCIASLSTSTSVDRRTKRKNTSTNHMEILSSPTKKGLVRECKKFNEDQSQSAETAKSDCLPYRARRTHAQGRRKPRLNKKSRRRNLRNPET